MFADFLKLYLDLDLTIKSLRGWLIFADTIIDFIIKTTGNNQQSPDVKQNAQVPKIKR